MCGVTEDPVLAATYVNGKGRCGGVVAGFLFLFFRFFKKKPKIDKSGSSNFLFFFTCGGALARANQHLMSLRRRPQSGNVDPNIVEMMSLDPRLAVAGTLPAIHNPFCTTVLWFQIH